MILVQQNCKDFQHQFLSTQKESLNILRAIKIVDCCLGFLLCHKSL